MPLEYLLQLAMYYNVCLKSNTLQRGYDMKHTN